MKTKNSYINLTGSLKHQMCSYTLEEDGKCEFCTRVMKSVKQQKFCICKNAYKTPKRINLLLDYTKHLKLKRLRITHKSILHKKKIE